MLDEIEQQMCDLLLMEHEHATTLKDKNNKKSPGLDELTTEFYNFFWNEH